MAEDQSQRLRENPYKIISFDGYDMDVFPLDGEKWPHGVSKQVVFFRNLPPFTVTLIDISDVSAHLDNFSEDTPIAIDFEWNPLAPSPVLNVYQFCQETQVLVIHDEGTGSPSTHLLSFISGEGGHTFFGKGCHRDLSMLRRRFGNVRITIEDIAQTRLIPYGHSENFEAMTTQFAGETTVKFKDKAVAMSQWDSSLSYRQVLYAAFDVAALCACYPHFPPPKPIEKVKVSKRKGNSPTKPKRMDFATETIVERSPISSAREALKDDSPWLLREQRKVMILNEPEPVTITVLSADDPLLPPILASIVGDSVVMNVFNNDPDIPMLFSIRAADRIVVIQRYEDYNDFISELWNKPNISISVHQGSVDPLHKLYDKSFRVVNPGNTKKTIPRFGAILKSVRSTRLSIALIVSCSIYTSMCLHKLTQEHAVTDRTVEI